MCETGYFATLWKDVAVRFGLDVDLVPGDWRTGADPEQVRERLSADRTHRIRAVAVVHNETSTGVASRIPELRAAIDAAKHPALFLVDTVSSLGSMEYRHDAWGVDVAVGASQKGLMLPPGLCFNALGPRAIAAAAAARLPRSYWDWQPMLRDNGAGFFPYTPATNLLYGLSEALAMLDEEGLEAVLSRHRRHGEATRRAVAAWGLDLVATDAREFSASVTAVRMPPGHDADSLRKLILDRFDMSLGTGLGKLKGAVFRIGHLGGFDDLSLAGTLAGVEMGLGLAGVPFRKGGVAAALERLAER
jgi:alanine-glyoxylate transaminase/serine-glyoxylate transaminase/serine-pyruvate transaminase